MQICRLFIGIFIIRDRKRLCGDHLRRSFVNSSFLRPSSSPGTELFLLTRQCCLQNQSPFLPFIQPSLSLISFPDFFLSNRRTLCRNQNGMPKRTKVSSTAGDSRLFSCSKNCNVIIFLLIKERSARVANGRFSYRSTTRRSFLRPRAC